MAAWLQLLLLVAIVAAAMRPLGDYIAWALDSPRTLQVERRSSGSRACEPTPSSDGRATRSRCSRSRSSRWRSSTCCSACSRRCRWSLGLPGVEASQAFNTAASFTSNTNWQSYAGESTMGHLVQMAGLAVQNFLSAAVGIAVAVALIRGFTRAKSDTIGNFWTDLVRSTVRVLLPIAFVAAVVMVSQGVVQNLARAACDRDRAGRGTSRCRVVRWRRRRRSRSSARTAAASTTPTPRTRSRTRARSRTCCRSRCCW